MVQSVPLERSRSWRSPIPTLFVRRTNSLRYAVANFPREHAMTTRTCFQGTSVFFFAVVLLLMSRPAPAQKNSPEKKGAEPTVQTASSAEASPQPSIEDPLFKGMKYRLVGPFR